MGWQSRRQGSRGSMSVGEDKEPVTKEDKKSGAKDKKYKRDRSERRSKKEEPLAERED